MSEVLTEGTAATVAEPTLIREGRLQANTWKRFEAAEGDAAALPPDDGDWLVDLALWRTASAQLQSRAHPVGLLLKSDDDPRELVASGLVTDGLALIAIDFPAYTDGRGYSIAQILRTRLAWQGELRAVGDVLIDTIHYQARCGFDSFLLKAGHDPQLALEAFEAFSFHYQKTYPAPRRQG